MIRCWLFPTQDGPRGCRLDESGGDPECRQKIPILIGAGARGTDPLLIEMATLLGASIAKALLGKDVLPDDLSFVTGAIARYRAKLGPDARLRYAPDGRDWLSLVGILA